MNTRLTVTLGALGAVSALGALTACSPTTAGHPSAPVPPPAASATTAGTTTAAPAPATPAAPTALPDACRLLTRAQAGALAGIALTAPQDTPAIGDDTQGSCEWDAPFTGPSGSVQVFVEHDVPRALGIDKAIHHVFRTVPGIGEQTLEEPQNSSIFIHKGDVWVYVNVPYGASPARLEAAARAIAARLV